MLQENTVGSGGKEGTVSAAVEKAGLSDASGSGSVTVHRTEEEQRQFSAKCEYFVQQLPRLTPTERSIYHFYLAGKNTSEIMHELNIKENTLKYHNKNIYGKLGISSRKQLLEIASVLGLTKSE